MLFKWVQFLARSVHCAALSMRVCDTQRREIYFLKRRIQAQVLVLCKCFCHLQGLHTEMHLIMMMTVVILTMLVSPVLNVLSCVGLCGGMLSGETESSKKGKVKVGQIFVLVNKWKVIFYIKINFSLLFCFLKIPGRSNLCFG